MLVRKKGILIIGAVLIIGIIILGGCYHMIGRRVTEAAQKYVAQNFAQEMQLINTSVALPIIDGVRHRSYFSPSDNHELVFFVEVEPGTFIVRGNTYYSAFFELGMENKFVIDVSDIWKDDALLNVDVHSRNRLKFRTPSSFDGREPITETLEEMAATFYSESFQSYGFDFIINVNRSLNDDSKIEEASRILGFIQILQNSNFRPDTLIFYYRNPNQRVWSRFFNRTQIEIRIRDWNNIEVAEQINMIF
jgi:hypothetical protein